MTGIDLPGPDKEAERQKELQLLRSSLDEFLGSQSGTKSSADWKREEGGRNVLAPDADSSREVPSPTRLAQAPKTAEPQAPGQGAPQGPLPPRDEPPTPLDQFQRPLPQWSPSLLTQVPQNDLEFEAWAKQATVEATRYLNGLDEQYVGFMAQQGRLDDYMMEQVRGTDEADHAARLEIAAKMMPFAGPRTPQLRTMIGMELRSAAARPEMAAQLAPVQQQWDVDRHVEDVQPAASQRVSAAVERAAAERKGEGVVRRYVGNPAAEAARGTTLRPEAGSPEHRLSMAVVQQADQESAAMASALERIGLSKDAAKKRAESFRTKLVHGGYDAVEKSLKEAGVDENTTEWLMRKVAHFTGFPIGAGLAAGAGKSVLRGGNLIKDLFYGGKTIEQVASVAGKTSKLMRAAEFMAGSAGIFGWSKVIGPGDAFEPTLAKLEGPERERARDAASNMNALMATIMLPMLHYSQLVGRASTLGMTSAIGEQIGKGAQTAFESALGFQISAEGGGAAINYVRRKLLETGEKDPEAIRSALDLTLDTFPDTPGLLQQMFTAAARGDGPAVRQAAQEFGKEFVPTMAGFGVVVGIGLVKPALLKRSDLNQARKEVQATLSETDAKVANQVIDEIGESMPKPTAAEAVKEAGPKAEAAKKTAGKLAADIERFRGPVDQAYQASGGGPDEVVAAVVKATGADLTNPREATALWLAISQAVHSRHPREPGQYVVPAAVAESNKLNEAFEEAKRVALEAKAAPAAEPVSRETAPVVRDPRDVAIQPTADERAQMNDQLQQEMARALVGEGEGAGKGKVEREAARVSTEAAAKATDPTEAATLEAEASIRQDRAEAYEAGAEPPPLTPESVTEAKRQPGRILKRDVEAARADEQASQRAMDYPGELQRVETTEEGRRASEDAVVAMDAAQKAEADAELRAEREAVALADAGGGDASFDIEAMAKEAKPRRRSKPGKRRVHPVVSRLREIGGIDLVWARNGFGVQVTEGAPSGVFRKGGKSLDQAAMDLEASGYIRTPEGGNSLTTLMDLLEHLTHNGWKEPDFSDRAELERLAQEHDEASRGPKPPETVNPRRIAAGEAAAVPESASAAAKLEAAVAAVGQHFMEHVAPGDLVELADGQLLTVASKPFVNRGRVMVRATNAAGKTSPYSMRQLVALGERPTGVRARKSASKPAESEPASPIEKAQRATRSKREKIDQQIDEASAESAQAETPEQFEEAQARVQEGLADRRESEAAAVLAEKLQTTPATDPDATMPPQAEPTESGVSRGPTDANNFEVEELKPEQRRVIRLLEELRATGVLKDLVAGKKPRKTKNEQARSFAAYYEQTAHRYGSMPAEEAVPEALRDWLRESSGLPRRSEPLTVTVERLSKQLDAILAMDDKGAAAEALVKLQRDNVAFISGPEAHVLRFSPRALRFLNRMEAGMVRLMGGGSQAGIALVPGVEEWSQLYQRLARTWPMVNPGYWLNPSGHYLFDAARLDEMTRMFTKDPNGGPVSWFGRMWDATVGSPERWGNRLVAEAAREMNLIYTKTASLLHRTIGKNAEWRLALEGEHPEGNRNERVFDALNEGPESEAWAKLSPEEAKVATEVRAVHQAMWDALEPFTQKGRWLRKMAAANQRQLDVFGQRLQAEAEARETKMMEAVDAGEEVDIGSLKTPKDQERALQVLVATRNRLAKMLAANQEHGGIENFIHHVAEERGATLASLTFSPDTLQAMRMPGSVRVGAMLRRTGKLEKSGRLKRDVLASVADYFPQAVIAYHKNSMLARWSDFLYGTERPLTMEDLFDREGSDGLRRNSSKPVFYKGREWGYGGLVFVAPDGKLHEPRVQDAEGNWTKNPAIPKGSKRRVMLQDWANRTQPWLRERAPAPSRASVQADTEFANRVMFRQIVKRYGVLDKMVTAVLGKDGMDTLWEAYQEGPDGKIWKALPSKLKKEFLAHISYLPPHDGRVAYVNPRVLEAVATVRDGGWVDRASPERVTSLREYLDRFAGTASDARVSFFKFDGTISAIGRAANAAKIGWWNVKTAMTVITGGTFYNAAMPFHPAVLMDASQLAFRALWRWRSINKDATSLTAEDIVAGHPQSPFQAGSGKMRRHTAEELAALPPEERARADVVDDAFEAMFEDPVFVGKIGEMSRVLTQEGSAERMSRKMAGWKPGQVVQFGGRTYHVEGPATRQGKYVRVPVRRVLPVEGDANGKIVGKVKHISERTEPYGSVMQLLRGERGYELIEAMESYIRAQSFLAGYMTARKAGRTHEQARLMGQNATLYAHGVFNQMTASAFFRSPLGPFLGGIKSYAARQLGVWMRSPMSVNVRYAGMAMGANAMFRALGLGDITNAIGTSVAHLPLVGPFVDEQLSKYEDSLSPEDNKQNALVDLILRPGTLGIQVPLGESPATGLVSGLWTTAKDVATGDYSGALHNLMRTGARTFLPSMGLEAYTAYSSKESEPGRFNAVPLTGDRTSYKLNQSGTEQLLLSMLTPGTQLEKAQQFEQVRMGDARKRVVEGRRSDWRSRFDQQVRMWDESAKAGTLTPAKQAAIKESMQQLVQEGQPLGFDVTRHGLVAAQKEAQERNRIDELGPVQRSILNSGTKLARVQSFMSAIERNALTTKEAHEVAKELRGQQSFAKWLRDPHVPPDVQARFISSYEKFSARQPAAATR